jgi:hypothetical protein
VTNLDALTRIIFAFYAKVRVLVMTLFFDVLLDDFVGDIAAADAKVSACPQVASPELLSQVWELTHQLIRTLSLEHLEQPTNSQTWRHAHEQVEVIAGGRKLGQQPLQRLLIGPAQAVATAAKDVWVALSRQLEISCRTRSSLASIASYASNPIGRWNGGFSDSTASIRTLTAL